MPTSGTLSRDATHRPASPIGPGGQMHQTDASAATRRRYSHSRGRTSASRCRTDGRAQRPQREVVAARRCRYGTPCRRGGYARRGLNPITACSVVVTPFTFSKSLSVKMATRTSGGLRQPGRGRAYGRAGPASRAPPVARSPRYWGCPCDARSIRGGVTLACQRCKLGASSAGSWTELRSLADALPRQFHQSLVGPQLARDSTGAQARAQLRRVTEEDGGNGLNTEKQRNGDEQRRASIHYSLEFLRSPPLLRSSVLKPFPPSPPLRVSERSVSPRTGDGERHARRLDVHEQPAAVGAVARARPLRSVDSRRPGRCRCSRLRQVHVVHREGERLAVEREAHQPLALGERVAGGVLAQQQTRRAA